MTVQSVAINIGSLGNLKPTIFLSMVKMRIIIIICLKMEVFMIGLGNELLIKTGLIMKVMKKNVFGRKANGVQEV